MEKVVTYLELADPGALVAASAVAGLGLRLVDRGSPLVRTVQAQVGADYGWGASSRTERKWREYLAAHPAEQYWMVTFEEEIAGVAYLEPQPGGAVELSAFGLLPEYLGRGLGAYALTLALQQAWATEPLGAQKVQRVWLHTCSLDHPNALANYRKRGLRPYRVEVEPVL